MSRNRWRDAVTHQYDCAYHAWWLEREAAALGYKTEMREWMDEHPAPRLADFMQTMAGSAI
jgi:hypothetical protein